MKKLFLVILALFICTQASAQYYENSQTPASNNTIPFNHSMNKRQWLYYPNDLTPDSPVTYGMQTGMIYEIYLRSPDTTPVSFALLTVSLKNTTITQLSSTFETGLTQVYQGSYTDTPVNGWLKIEVQTPFLYQVGSNLIMECSQVGRNPGFSLMQTNSGKPLRSVAGYLTNTTGTTQGVLAWARFLLLVPTDPEILDRKTLPEVTKESKYYNMNGQRVEKPTVPGMYILVDQYNNRSKIVVQ